MSTPRILAFFPVFNEQDRLEPLLVGLRQILAEGVVDEVLAVDDGSTDRTPQLLAAYQEFTVITHPVRRGIGDAIRSAYRHALSHDHDVFVVMAGNGKDDPRQIGRLLEPILRDEADYVQGSRFLKGGYREGLPLHRLVAMRLFTWTFSLFLMHRFTDCSNGFRAYRVEILRDPQIDWEQEWLGDGYELEYYMHFKVVSLGYRVQEVPVSKIYRRAADGTYSKIKSRDWIRTLKPLFLLRAGLKK